ncbi:CLIP domain-containing serine protease B4-like [Cydia amplana]|uniref:CLIP domain-containing serine protease B4-like n=1 Tax=Cydia amplana TaxID=1869771 RepID=UPI002FE5B1AC
MRAKDTLCVVLAWLSCALAYQKQSCSDCVGYRSCAVAVALLGMKTQAADEKFKSAFCGFDGAKLPMVCCSQLSTESTPDVESVENHPNLNLLPDSCGKINGDKIIGGKIAGLYDYPWMTLISYNTRLGPQFECGGSLINERYVLTAAHCISNLKLLGVRIGENDVESSTDCQGDPPTLTCESKIQVYLLSLSYFLYTKLTLKVHSLINERYMLTAAHCISNLKLLGVKIGENDVESTTDCQGDPPTLTCESKIQDIRIEESIPHPEYQGKPNVKNDIGLLRLKKPVDLSFKNADIICLPVSRDLQSRNLGGLNATVAGWGYTEKGYISSKLLTVDVPIHTADSCRELYNRGQKPGDEDQTINKICAGENGKDSCGGDSGGPLMVKGAYKSNGERFIEHGIVSYGPRLCGSDFPGVYTDVSKYMKWILDNIRP